MGGGCRPKKPSVGGYGFFSGTTQHILLNTDNFSYRYPMVAVCIGLAINKKVQINSVF